MKKSKSNFIVIFSIGLFLLACALLPIPNTTINISPTFTPLPALPPEQPTDTGMGLKDENLLAAVPPGFEIGHQAQQDTFVIKEMVRNGETVDN
jgi:hypothetical protein